MGRLAVAILAQAFVQPKMQVALRVLFAVVILFSLVYSLEKGPKELELEDPDDELEDPDDDDDDDGDEDEDEVEEMAPIEQKMLQKLRNALTSEQIRSMHSKIDKNGDGRISLHEIMDFDAMMRKTIAKKDIDPFLDGMDSDKDGKLSLAELFKDIEMENAKWDDEESEEDKAEVKKRKDNDAEKFNLADTDGDGFLKAEELPALIHPETDNGMLELVAGQTMKDKDVNGDGKLTSKEFWKGHSVSDEEKENFKKLDADKDGFINFEELKAWESGDFQTEEAMKKLVELSDKDRDMHVTADELDEARRLNEFVATDAQHILMEWAEQEHHQLRSALSTTNSEHQEL